MRGLFIHEWQTVTHDQIDADGNHEEDDDDDDDDDYDDDDEDDDKDDDDDDDDDENGNLFLLSFHRYQSCDVIICFLESFKSIV